MKKLALLILLSTFCGLTAPGGARAQDVDFATFLAGVRDDGLKGGLKPETLGVLDQLAPLDKVVELDHRQPEFNVTFAAYLTAIMKPERIKKGRALLRENRALMTAVGKKYGVQPRFVVALWAIESGYGQSMGNYPVVASLATLAWEGRRRAFFRNELMAALSIIDNGDVPADKMIGSWAGAMGQCQFMPTTYLKYAQDWEGDGRRDIWRDRGDVLASTANYLSQIGWHDDQGWGRKVKLPAKLDHALVGLDKSRTLKEWQALGVRAANGKALPNAALQASLVVTDVEKGDGKGPAFLVYDNFRSVMTWNHSTFFALAVGHLADALGRR